MGFTPLLEKLGLKGADPLTEIFIRGLVIIVVHFVFYLFSGRLNELTKISLKNFFSFAAESWHALLQCGSTSICSRKVTSKIVAIADPLSITAVLASSSLLRNKLL